MFTDGGGEPIHPHAISQTFERIARRAAVPVIRLHDLRHTHGTLLIAAGIPVKVVTERRGHAAPGFATDTYQHVMPGMQAHAAWVFEELVVGDLLPAHEMSEKTREKHREKAALTRVEVTTNDEGPGRGPEPSLPVGGGGGI